MVIGRPDVATLGCDGPLARRGRPQVRQGCASPWRGGGGALPRGEEEERTTWASKPAEPPREPRGERGPQATLWRRIPAGGGGTKAWVSQPTAPPGSGNRGSVPLPHCPPSPAAAIAAATMPKRKKQNQQQPPPPPPQPARWDRDEPGDDDDDEEEEGEEESPIGEGEGVHTPVQRARGWASIEVGGRGLELKKDGRTRGGGVGAGAGGLLVEAWTRVGLLEPSTSVWLLTLSGEGRGGGG
ncbi:hypothetical protein NN561_001930 [Cricetulus griseus]